jgi:hypothetical protein
MLKLCQKGNSIEVNGDNCCGAGSYGIIFKK